MISDAPLLVTPPVTEVLTVPEARLHLRVDASEEDGLIADLIEAAVAYLDGWGGVLGRGIMPQQWAEEFRGWGDLPLSLPDVGDFTVVGIDAAGAEVPAASSSIAATRGGWVVTCAGGTVDKVRVTYQVALPPSRLPAAKAIVKLLVGHWYEHREAVATGTIATDLPMGATAMIGALRWVKWA
jgi:hypothetical protein